jgi:hypothetical protein
MGAIKRVIGIIIVALVLVFSCTRTAGEDRKALSLVQNQNVIVDTAGTTILTRFNPPSGFTRTLIDASTFGFYLRHLKLKSSGSLVRYYNGQTKFKPNVYLAVVDMEIGDRDLQQCADAVMRLRAEYLYARLLYQDIHFNFVSDGKPRFYEDYVEGDHSYKKFREYLDFVFSYANTLSLSRELTSLNSFLEMQIGDVFIQPGNPYGHAVIVVDMAEKPETGEKLFMLAQSYMPAQDIQILVNRKDPYISPWYLLGESQIETPEWTFHPGDLKRFED